MAPAETNRAVDVAQLFRSCEDLASLEAAGPQLAYRVEPGAFRVEARVERARTALGDALVEFGGEGWVCYSGRVALVDERSPLQGGDEWALSAELACGARSLHLRQAAGGWILTLLTREDERGAGWVVCSQFMGRGPARGRRLRYEVLWEPGPAGVLEPSASRFAGFAARGG